MGIYGENWGYLGIFGAIFKGILGDVLGCLGILGYSGVFGRYLGRMLGIFGDIGDI